MNKKQLEAFVELDKTILQEVEIELKTQKEMSDEANKVNHNLRHKELPRLTFWAYIWENFKKEFRIILKL